MLYGSGSTCLYVPWWLYIFFWTSAMHWRHEFTQTHTFSHSCLYCVQSSLIKIRGPQSKDYKCEANFWPWVPSEGFWGVGRQDIHAISHGRRSLPRVPVKGSFPSPWRLLWPVFCQRHSMDRFVSGRPLRVNCVIYWREENWLLGNQKHFLQFITRIFNTNGKIWKSC